MKIGFVIGRIGGIDGVALETEKWVAVLERMGHQVRVITGELEGDVANTDLLPELAFSDPWTIHEQDVAFFGVEAKESEFLGALQAQAARIERGLLGWIEREGIEYLVSENASALPCHLAMGMALRAVFERSKLPVVTHDHDFAWERGDRYSTPFEGVRRIMADSFPVRLPNVRHAVINRAARTTLEERFGVEDSVVVPNVMDFDASFAPRDEYNSGLLADLGLGPDAIPLFQITRIVRRKGIETAIDLVRRLNDPRVHLVITGTSTDDSDDYTLELQRQVEAVGLVGRVLFAGDRFANFRGEDAQGRRLYSLEDAYARARGCTYFSTYEGFGNAFVEAVVARCPIFVNNYEPVYWPDIGSLGFDTVMIEGGNLTDEAVAAVAEVLHDDDRAERMVARNFELGRRHFSYQALEVLLGRLFPAG